MRGLVRIINERFQLLIWKIRTFSQDMVARTSPVNTALVFLLVLLGVLVVYIPSFPAYTILPSEEVELVDITCRQSTKAEVYQGRGIMKKQAHRTLCTFNVFHHDLLNKNRIYFVIDININIAKTYQDGRDRKLFTIKIVNQHKEQNTHHKQKNMNWYVSRCNTMKDDLAICLYRRDDKVSRKIISTVMTGQNKTVSFLFLVDNGRQVLEIFSHAVLWKDVVFIEHYYESKTLSVWFSLADWKNNKYVTARIRSGANVTIGDLSPAAIEIVFGLLTYPFRWFYTSKIATPVFHCLFIILFVFFIRITYM